jgi:hypothetical protein
MTGATGGLAPADLSRLSPSLLKAAPALAGAAFSSEGDSEGLSLSQRLLGMETHRASALQPDQPELCRQAPAQSGDDAQRSSWHDHEYWADRTGRFVRGHVGERTKGVRCSNAAARHRTSERV